MNSRSAQLLSDGIAPQFLSFAAVGAVGTAAHYATLIAGVTLGLGPVIASALGCTVGAAVNYVLNYHVTFRSSLAHTQSAPRFAAIAAASLLLNTLLMAVGVDQLGLHYLVAQILATGIVLCSNFALSRFWAFSEPTRNASR